MFFPASRAVYPLFGLVFLVHAIGAVLVIVGAILLFIWAIKNLSGPKLKHVALWMLGIGIVACILAAALSFAMVGGRGGMMGGFRNGGFTNGGYGNGSMMRWNQDASGGSESSDDTLQQEAAGKAVWQKLQAKQVTCGQLTDSDFEALGEYQMGQMVGTSHAGMNRMVQGSIGADGETAMHVAMGKRLSGCDPNAVIPGGTGFNGMMRGSISGSSSSAGTY